MDAAVAIQQRLLELAQGHPSGHPFTLVLRLQVETGTTIRGLQVRAWRREARALNKAEAQP